MGGGRVYTMFAAPVRFVEPLMFHLATQHNAAAKAVAGAEKTSFAWVKGALPSVPQLPYPSPPTRQRPLTAPAQNQPQPLACSALACLLPSHAPTSISAEDSQGAHTLF